MPKLYKKVKKVALPPGTLAAVEGAAKAKIHLVDYTEKDFQEKELATIEESFSFRDSNSISWINIDGQDIEVIKKIDEHFGIHPLVLEDIVNLGQRPKVEDYGEYLFFVLKMVYFAEKINDIYAEQVGLILGHNFVISFQEKDGDVFDPIKDDQEATIAEGIKFAVRQCRALLAGGAPGLHFYCLNKIHPTETILRESQK